MQKNYLILFLLFSIGLFSQNNLIDSIVISKAKFAESVDRKFSYLITNDKTIAPAKLLKNNKLQKDYCNCIFTENKNQFKELWLVGKVINQTKDTLDLVYYNCDIPVMEVYLITNHKTTFKQLGYLQKNEDRFSEEIPNCFPLQLVPNQETYIVLHQKIINPNYSIGKLNILTRDKYNEMLLDQFKKYHTSRMVFGILLGGVLLIIGYNSLLFFKTTSKTYLYYLLYLFCVFSFILLIIDKNQNHFLGRILLYSGLLKEIFYTLSIVLYGYFILSVADLNKLVKKTVAIYFIFALFYLAFLTFEFLHNPYDFSLFDDTIILIIKCFTFIYLAFVIFKLYKKITTNYLKYIFIGSIIIFFSYLLQFMFLNFFKYISGNRTFNLIIRNNFVILLGTIIEVCFFSYALYIKSSQVVKEKMHLENMNQIKSRFFANISHEFRTPLTLIKSPVQSLQNEISDENQINKLDLIDKNSTRMLQLVDQLLELSKIDSGNLQLIIKDGNISAFLNSIIESFEFEAKEKGINFISKIQKTKENNAFDKDVVQKIVSNLVSNAFKYSPQNETITFTSLVENFNLKLVVSNTGSDIKKEDLSKLFERFYQKNDNQQGVGIGLALVKELVDLYKGTITTSLENGELSFIVNLPLATANENAVVIPYHETTSKIENTTTNETELPILLIVDDNAEIRSVLKDIFATNYQILEAQDGEEGLKLAQNQIPDCIISDVMMPKMDGFEFTKQIKNNELTSFIPLILLTARTTDEAHLEGLRSTADAFLTKPFNNEIVKATVQQLITERKKLHQRYSQELVLRPVDIVINSVDEKFIEKLQVILDKEISNADFSAENFAVSVGMSRMQLHRKLKSLLGVTATEFLRNERLKIATKLLKDGNGNISDVTYAVGFNDVSYFSKCFKEMYSCTPTEFIEKK